MNPIEVIQEFEDLKSLKDKRKFAKAHGLPNVDTYKGATGKKRLSKDFPLFIGGLEGKRIWEERMANLTDEEKAELFSVEADDRPLKEQMADLLQSRTKVWEEAISEQAKEREKYLGDVRIWVPLFWNTLCAQQFDPLAIQKAKDKLGEDGLNCIEELMQLEDQPYVDYAEKNWDALNAAMSDMFDVLRDIAPPGFYFGIDTDGRTGGYGFWKANVQEEVMPTEEALATLTEEEIVEIIESKPIMDTENATLTEEE